MLKLMILLGASVALSKSEYPEHPWIFQHEPRMVWDTSVEFNYEKFPWVVPIFYHNVFFCSGALILPDIVLTTAHCLRSIEAKFLKVSAGAWNLGDLKETYRQDRNVSNYIVHEKYDRGSGANDYALVFLSKPVKLTEDVALVSLPKVNDDFTGSTCFEYGWIRNVLEHREQIYLEINERLVLKHEDCQNILRTLRHQPKYVLHESFICTGGETGISTSRRNEGSPLSCQLRNSDPTRYVLAGIVSWGPRGKNAPTILANVAAAHTWINAQLANRKL